MVSFRLFWSKLRTIDKIAIALLVLVAIAQIFLMATVTPDGDADNHVYRIALWRRMWQAHIYYPRWMPQAYSGFGAPTFYVYPPLAYIVSSILYLFDRTVSPTARYRIVALIFCAGSLITACWYLRSRGIGT